MSEHENVVDRADALMRRRRHFVASRPPAPLPDIPTLTVEASERDEDLPVLTEVITAKSEVPGHHEAFCVASTPTEHIAAAATLPAQLAAEISQAIGKQLAAELPTLLEAVLLNARAELQIGITSTVEAALREVLQRHPDTPRPPHD